MKYLVSGINAPINTTISKEFGAFAELYKGVILS